MPDDSNRLIDPRKYLSGVGVLRPKSLIARFVIGDTYRARLTRQAGGSFAVRVAAAGLGFLSGVLFARILGVEGYGAYAYAMSWVTVLTVPCLMGTDQLLVRETGAFATQGRWDLLRGMLRWVAWTVPAVSVAAAAVGLVLNWYLLALPAEMRTALTIALISLPLVVFLAGVQAAQRGFQRIVAGQWPNMVAKPALAVSLLLAVTVLITPDVDAALAVAIQASAALAVLVLSLYLLRRAIPSEVKCATARSTGTAWLRKALPLLVFSGVVVANGQLEVLMLGTLHGAEAAALFAVALRAAQLVAFPLIAVNAVLAPTVSRFAATDDRQRLQLALRNSASVLLLVSAPIALLLWAVGPWFLNLFGPQFVEARALLNILILGQVLNVATGSVDVLLVMSGRERVVIATFACVLLAKALAIGVFASTGTEAAAIAASLGLVVSNAILCVYAVRHLNIDTTAFGALTALSRLRR